MNNKNTQDPILTAESLSKSFPSGADKIEVLKNASFSLHPNESLSIRGDSGSGKTTLLNIISGLDSPTSGNVLWQGQNINRLKSDQSAILRSQVIGFIFQAYYLIPELNALDNVLMAKRLTGKVTNKDKQRAQELLSNIGLSKRMYSVPSKLSGGERQRIAFVRSIINKPKLIIADEPTGNLDESTASALMQTLLNLCKQEGAGLILVTHNKAFAQLTDRQLLLTQGQLEDITL